MKINILISERRMEEYIDKHAKLLYYIDIISIIIFII